MLETITSYFTDPILQPSFFSCILMCISASIIGVIVFVQKKSLIGETLSHATYPGIVVGIFITATLPLSTAIAGFIPLLGAAIFALIALFVIKKMTIKHQLHADAALCMVLSGFFALGMLLTTALQYSFPDAARLIQLYLYGQVATLMQEHLWFYSSLTLSLILFVTIFLSSIEALCLHRDFAKSLGIRVRTLEIMIFIFLVLTIVSGIRSIGIILMSGMIIAPAASARQYSDKLKHIFILSAFFALLSASIGFIFSTEGSRVIAELLPFQKISFPIGPFIVLTASLIALLSLLFAPKRGAVFRLIRIFRFRMQTAEENVLKGFFVGNTDSMSFKQLKNQHNNHPLLLHILLRKMRKNQLLSGPYHQISLSPHGKKRAEKIEKLHLLWEEYLSTHLGGREEMIHGSAEEMEHIITRELEEKLTHFLSKKKEVKDDSNT